MSKAFREGCRQKLSDYAGGTPGNAESQAGDIQHNFTSTWSIGGLDTKKTPWGPGTTDTIRVCNLGSFRRLCKPQALTRGSRVETLLRTSHEAAQRLPVITWWKCEWDWRSLIIERVAWAEALEFPYPCKSEGWRKFGLHLLLVAGDSGQWSTDESLQLDLYDQENNSNTNGKPSNSKPLSHTSFIS